MVALKQLGYKMNTKNEAELQAAESWLMGLSGKKNVSFFNR